MGELIWQQRWELLTGGFSEETLCSGAGSASAPCQRNTAGQIEGALGRGRGGHGKGVPVSFLISFCSSGSADKDRLLDPAGQYPRAPWLKLGPKLASALLAGLHSLEFGCEVDQDPLLYSVSSAAIIALSPKAAEDEPAPPLFSRPCGLCSPFFL